jgi:hypothetical protein
MVRNEEARRSKVQDLGGVSAIMGASMNQDMHPKFYLDKSNLKVSETGQLHAIFNEGDISMMDEMNRILNGLNPQTNAAKIPFPA